MLGKNKTDKKESKKAQETYIDKETHSLAHSLIPSKPKLEVIIYTKKLQDKNR